MSDEPAETPGTVPVEVGNTVAEDVMVTAAGTDEELPEVNWPADLPVLGTAVAGDAELIVSVDSRIDFLPAAAEEHSAAKHLDAGLGAVSGGAGQSARAE